MNTRKSHWEQVYETKTPEQVSWTQEVPNTSLELIAACNLNKDAKIIDIGGGDSNLVDFLLKEGYSNITVLDISGKALERAQTRLGKDAAKVHWVESDINQFKPTASYDIWHDRAAFHFLTDPNEIETYVKLCSDFVNDFLILGTFSQNGPLKCSGLEISQYNEAQISDCFQANFNILQSRTEDHTTPFDTTQNFLFSRFQKK
jgi:SAM-dependent methyltransferase